MGIFFLSQSMKMKHILKINEPTGKSDLNFSSIKYRLFYWTARVDVVSIKMIWCKTSREKNLTFLTNQRYLKSYWLLRLQLILYPCNLSLSKESGGKVGIKFYDTDFLVKKNRRLIYNRSIFTQFRNNIKKPNMKT